MRRAGVAALMFFSLIGLPVSPLTLIIGHTVVCVPYVVRTTVAALAQLDPALLETRPPAQRLEGMAEVVKTGLLAGEPLWELPDDELVRRCAAFKAAMCLRDPHDDAERKLLNLGHTFAHALEASGEYDDLLHGEAVAVGLVFAGQLAAALGRVDASTAERHRQIVTQAEIGEQHRRSRSRLAAGGGRGGLRHRWRGRQQAEGERGSSKRSEREMTHGVSSRDGLCAGSD